MRRIPESGHVVVCGLGAIGFLTLKELLRSGERVVAIEKDLTNPFVATARRLGAAVIIGDAALPEVQKQAKMHTAYSVIASTTSRRCRPEAIMAAASCKHATATCS